ncbi:hypothetical protein [Pseudozobellia sp. WGM2]|uniref:hypothetical protein n=1 Tax=Pseudozobellia sp. WGM2 TaxID=2787625 RepID=UPI001AE03334|nr:hypothetical protein [Pseudozobellia sp. WGM2]
MRHFLVISITILTLFGFSCRKDFEYTASSGNLHFSKDTVYLDTVFSSIGSSTYTLKVYNHSGNDIQIPSISLGKGQESAYRLNVDGIAGKNFTNIPVNSKDSLFIFIESTIDISDAGINEFLYTDLLQFDEGDNLQEIALVTLVKDAIFLYPEKDASGKKRQILVENDTEENLTTVPGFEFGSDELVLTNDKPYVVYGYAAIPQSKSLLIEAGTRIHFHKNSGLYVSPGSSLKIEGAVSQDSLRLENEVIFEGNRLDHEFSDQPAQWDGVIIASGSTSNEINHLTLKNALTGIKVFGDDILNEPTLSLRNTQVYNSLINNLRAISAFIIGENCVFGSSGGSSFLINSGGSYSFNHSTIANYWTDGLRTSSALQIDNEPFGKRENSELIKADFQNSIIYGNNANEISLTNNNSNTFNYFFNNCLIKLEDQAMQNESPFDAVNDNHYLNNFFNEDVHFRNTIHNNFQLSPESFAIGKADPDISVNVPQDINGIFRDEKPDIGAYEFH